MQGGSLKQSHVVVVGAGVMGLWSALRLRETGHEVTLVDAWGAGNPRATSGDENRVIRCGYGGSRLYAGWSRASLETWAARQREWGVTLLHRCGVLWMVAGGDPYEAYAGRCLQDLRELRVNHEQLDSKSFARRYPQISPRGIRWAVLEPESGAVLARRACLALAEAFLRAGGRFRLGCVLSPRAADAGRRSLRHVRLSSAELLSADQFLFACGPWLPGLFPGLLKKRIKVSRKEVFYFGPPAGDDRFSAPRLPVWMELGTSCYGLPSLQARGFKVHPDLAGSRVDPTRMDRRPSSKLLMTARRCLKRRFPDLAGAPLVEARVCQYEATRDDHMILDRHPEMTNVWIAGGGSGHCFKHGPVIGELAAEAIASGRLDSVPSELRLAHTPRGRNF